MLALGHGDFDENHITEARAHMSMWAIMASPLLLGYDLRQSPQSLLDVAGNREVIAIDQDPAGNQGIAYRTGDTMVVVRTLAGSGARAVVLFNRGEQAASARVDWTQLGYAPGTSANVRDVWKHENMALAKDSIAVKLKPHEAVMFRLSGTPVDPAATYLDEMPWPNQRSGRRTRQSRAASRLDSGTRRSSARRRPAPKWIAAFFQGHWTVRQFTPRDLRRRSFPDPCSDPRPAQVKRPGEVSRL